MIAMTAMLAASALYEKGDWSSLWWLPKAGTTPVPGSQVAVDDGKRLPHLIFVPSGSPPPGGWPLLVFLHGQGESSGASELARVALQGPPQQAGRHPEHIPFAVLSPQKPLTTEFFDQEVAAAIVALIDAYVASLGLNSRKVYLTGLSQGGIGTWGIASDPQYASRFAAVAPVCGGFVHGNKAKRAAAMSDTPVWAFHGENDSILPVDLSDSSYAALQATTRTAYAGAPKYTRLEHARGSDYSWAAAGVPPMEGHASWVEAYYPPGLKASSLPPLYEWMLGHARGEANATGGASDERDARASRTHAGVARASRLAAAAEL